MYYLPKTKHSDWSVRFMTAGVWHRLPPIVMTPDGPQWVLPCHIPVVFDGVQIIMHKISIQRIQVTKDSCSSSQQAYDKLFRNFNIFCIFCHLWLIAIQFHVSYTFLILIPQYIRTTPHGFNGIMWLHVMITWFVFRPMKSSLYLFISSVNRLS